MTQVKPGEVPFQSYVALVETFLGNRKAIVERIESLLNAQRKPPDYLQDRPLLMRLFEDCCFGLPALAPDQARLRGQLEQAHWDSGFRPRQVPGLFSDLINPAEMMIRGFFLWQQTRWPGRNGRLSYAQTLFNVYLIRCLQFLSMRLWDADANGVGDRLAQVQALLDVLWQGTPADQPVLVRDARWLIPMAQSPTTDELAAYFEVAERVAETLAEEDQIEIARAHVRMLGGHLTSQIRHYCINEGISIDDHSVVLRTRTSNALDFALLVQNLVILLEAYEAALETDDDATRRELAGAICQGISPDPELFLNRLEMLGPHSMIEHLFIGTDSKGQVVYTPMGRRHDRLLQGYVTLIGRLATPLAADCPQFRPINGTYSPYGAIFGTPTNLVEDMVLKSTQRDAETRFSLEDVFVDGDDSSERLAWISGWRKLPHIDAEVQEIYAYPQAFAADIHHRVGQELARSQSDEESQRVEETGRLFIISDSESQPDSATASIPALPPRYIAASDPAVVSAGAAVALDEKSLLHGRNEAYFLVSYASAGGWVAVKKDLLTEQLGEGRDVRIGSLPFDAAQALRLMCRELAAPGSAAD